MNELQLSKDLNVITAEINSYKQVAGQAVFEIGRRLKHVKENDLAYGQWSNWLRTIGMNRSTAHRFIKTYEELPSDVDTWQQLSSRALYEIATLPEEEREKEHVTSKGETKTVDEMTVRELQELKRKLREEEQAKEQAESQLEIERKERERLEKENESLAKIEPKVIEKEIIKEVDNTDYEKIDLLEQEIEAMKKRLELEQKDAETYRQLQKDINNLRNRKDDMIRQIDNASSIGKFIARVEKSFEEDLAPVKYSRAIEELERSEVVQESLEKIVSKVENWCREIRGLMKKKNIVEVIDYEEK